MSETQRVQLPVNADFGLPEVTLINDPSRYPVAAAELPGKSDDELRDQAEQTNNWDLYATHGIDQDPIPLTALWNRFTDTFRGEYVDRPGGFIKAVLAMQRTLPTAREYSAVLARDGLIRPQEVSLIQDTLPTSADDTDDFAAQARAQYKVTYLANTAVPELRTSELAAKYASDRLNSGTDQRARKRAVEALQLARGVAEADVAQAVDRITSGRATAPEQLLRQLGISDAAQEQLYSAPRPSGLFPRFKSADRVVTDVLSSSSLDRQIAYRQFFGTSNLVDVATLSAGLEAPFDDKTLAFSAYAVSVHLAGSFLVHTVIDSEKPWKSMFKDSYTADEFGEIEQMTKLGGLASFMMREPALSGEQRMFHLHSDVLGSHIVDMVNADYRTLLDNQMAAERSAA